VSSSSSALFSSRDALLAEKPPGRIWVTGNTVIDALAATVERLESDRPLAATLEKRHGWVDARRRLVLVTGPTGSGKSTTLATLVDILNSTRSCRIITGDEYIGSHYFRKLTQLEMSFGDSFHHLGEVSARMQDTAGVFA
jgi:Tfp pilus assembly ATPase PilU